MLADVDVEACGLDGVILALMTPCAISSRSRRLITCLSLMTWACNIGQACGFSIVQRAVHDIGGRSAVDARRLFDRTHHTRHIEVKRVTHARGAFPVVLTPNRQEHAGVEVTLKPANSVFFVCHRSDELKNAVKPSCVVEG